MKKTKRLLAVVFILLMFRLGGPALATGASDIQETRSAPRIAAESRTYDGQVPCLYSPLEVGCRNKGEKPVLYLLRWILAQTGWQPAQMEDCLDNLYGCYARYVYRIRSKAGLGRLYFYP